MVTELSTRATAQAVRTIVRDGPPAEVDQWARSMVRSLCAAQAAGMSTVVARAVGAGAAANPGPVPVAATSARCSAVWSALWSATAATALDLDEGHYRGGGIHAGAAVLPALLAVADDATELRAVRSALVAGFEVAIRVGYLASPRVGGGDYRASGYAAALGAAVATAALGVRAADDDSAVASIDAALRLGAAFAPVSTMTSDVSRESLGWAAAAAVTVAQLVAAGIAGELGVTEPRTPAGPTILDGATDPFVTSLGQVFESTACYQKPYPCCRAAHAALDGLRQVRERIDVAVIEKIDIETAAAGAGLCERAPRTLGQAQFSLPFLAALMLVRGAEAVFALGSAPDSSTLSDSRVLALAERVRIVEAADLEANEERSYPARVAVTTPAGVATATVLHAAGGPENPMSADALARRDEALLHRAFGPGQAAEIARVASAEDGTVGDLRRVLQPR